jgi:exosortase A
VSVLARTFNDEAVGGDGTPSRIGSPLAIVIGALALTALLYWPTSLEIAELWQDNDRRLYTHGGLVLAVTVWLIWRDRAQLASIRVTPPTVGWCVVAIGSVGWLVGFNAGLLAMTTLAMPLLALTAIWATAGVGVARRVAFAVLYLYFALPVWELLNPLLQSLTTLVNLWLAQLVGIPVAMEENFIHIPAGSFEIAGGCSGLHFLIVALAIAALQGEIDRDDLRSRALLLGIAAALALVTNWLRVFIIIVAGHLTKMQHFLVKVDHYYFGWFLFVFALGLYFYVSSRVPHAARTAPSKAQAVEQLARGRPMIAAVLSAAALALGPTWLFAGVGKIEPTGQESPPTLASWSGPSLYLSDWRPVFENSDEEFLAAYHHEAMGDVALYLATYHSQHQGKELRGYFNTVLGAQYQAKASHQRDIEAGGRAFSLSEQIAAGTNAHDLLIWSLFAIDGKPDPMGFSSQLAYGVRSLFRYPEASVLAMAAECRPDCDHARDAIGAFASQVLPEVLSGSGSK